MATRKADLAKRRITRIYIYVMLIAFPVFTGFGGYSNLTNSKLVFFVTATALWLMLLLAYSVKYRDFGNKRLNLIQILLLMYFGFCCISAILSPSKSFVLTGAGRFDGLLEAALYICIFLGVSRYAAPERGFVYALAISVTICCIVAIIQLLGCNPLGLFPEGYNYFDKGTLFSGEFLGTIGNANLFSAFLALCLPVFCAVYICSDENRTILLPAVSLGSFCLFACTVSAGKLAFLAAMLVLIPFVVTDMKRLSRLFHIVFILCLAFRIAFTLTNPISETDDLNRILQVSRTSLNLDGIALLFGIFSITAFALRKKRIYASALRTGIVLIELIALGFGLYYLYHYKGTEGTLYEFSRLLHGEVSDSYGSSRILIWRESLKLASNRPFFGGGPGTIALRLNIDFSRFVEETGRTLVSRVDNAHNVYLGILVNTGIFSLMAYLAAMIATLVKAVKHPKPRALTLSFACGLLCYWIQDFFGLGLFIVAPVMFICWGLAAAEPEPE